MKKILIFCIDKWWFPVLLFLFGTVLLIIGDNWNIQSLNAAPKAICIGSILLILVSGCNQFYKGRYLNGLVSLFVLLTILGISVAMSFVEGDHWADNRQIPSDVEVHSPLNMINYTRPDSILALKKTEQDLVLYNSDQPGMYEYDFWTGRLENGTIYLRAFEITQEEQLSQENIKEESEITIENAGDSIARYSSGKIFVYEGDWGQYYAARFEVWFKPKSGDQERRLFQKNFRIEGWMH